MHVQSCCFSNLNRCRRRRILSSLKGTLTGCVPFDESKNGFLILDLLDFVVKRNAKSEIGFVTLVTFRKRMQYA